MKCAVKGCGTEFAEPRVVAGAGCCPQCSCLFYFTDDGVLQGPVETSQYCHVCGLNFSVKSEDVYVEKKKGHELHACKNSRPCMDQDCTKDADKLLSVGLPLLNGQVLILQPPGGWAFCSSDALKMTADELAGTMMKNLPSVVTGGAIDPKKAELAVHDLDMYRPGGKFA